MTCQDLPVANANFQEFDFCWRLVEEKQSLFHFVLFLYVYVVMFILTFRVCNYGKQELSEAYLLVPDEQTDLSSIYRAREH